MRRQRNFNGCWTCRLRKVKCDATRPKCERCTKAGLVCEGYQIKLSFYQLLTISNGALIDLITKNETEEKYRRRTVEFARFPINWRYVTYEKLNSIVNEVDSIVEQGASNGHIGPFSVYSISQLVNVDDSNGDHHNKRSLIDTDLLMFAKLSIFGIKGPYYQITDQNIYHILYPSFFPNIDSDDWHPDEDITKFVRSNQEGIFVGKLYLKIIYHFFTLGLSFMKTLGQNPWLQIISPYLKVIMYDTLMTDLALETLGGNITKLIKDLKFVTHCLILSLSCFDLSDNKFKLNDKSSIDSYLKSSINLRKVAATKLNYHLDEYDNHMELHNDEYNLLLLINIILHVEIDNYFNIFENFELLFTIGEVVLTQSNTLVDLIDKRLVVDNLFYIMNTFFRSTQNITLYNYQIDDIEKYGDLQEEYDLTRQLMPTRPIISRGTSQADLPQVNRPNKEYMIDDTDYNDYSCDEFTPETNNSLDQNSVYLMYGLPRSLILLFNDIIHLTNHKRVFQLQNKYPRNFPKFCSEYEDKLHSWRNKWVLTKDGHFKSKFHHGLHYNIKIFHQCLTLYYNKLIKNEISQMLINNTYQDILELQELNININLTVWNLIILNFDNANSNFENIENNSKLIHHNLSHWRSKQMIKELNNRRENLDVINWMEIIREWDITLYLG